MPVVAVVNQKGGVGKTTISLGLAGAATARGLSTLVVDLDPQANATTGLGIFDDDLPTIADALDPDSDEPIERVLTTAAWPADRGTVPDLMPGSPELTIAERHLGDDPLGAQDRLATLLATLPHELIVIDCPPSVGLLTINALFAADQTLVVTEPAAWSHDAVAQVLDTIARVGARRRGAPGVSAVVINKLGRTRDNRYWADRIGEAVDPTPSPIVRLRAAIGEAAAQSLPVDALGRRSGVAEACAELDALLDLVLAADTSGGRAGGGNR
jgi:chromosome partitioning protein